MTEHLPYYALFYGLGLIVMGLFVRLYLRRWKLRDTEIKKSQTPSGKQPGP